LALREGLGVLLCFAGGGEPFGEGEGVGAPGVFADGERGLGGVAELVDGFGERGEGLLDGSGELVGGDGGFLGRRPGCALGMTKDGVGLLGQAVGFGPLQEGARRGRRFLSRRRSRLLPLLSRR